MLKVLQYSLVLVMIIFVSSCVAPDDAAMTEATMEAVEQIEQPLVSAELLKEADLEILWETKFPIKPRENLEKLYILGNRIYGFSNQNFMVSLNRNKGNMIFSRYIAHMGLPVFGLGLYEDELFSVAGSQLIQIDVDSGADISAKRLKFSAACPAVRNGSYFYVAGTDRRMRTFRSEDKVLVFEVAAEDDSRIVSVVADDEFVVFATDTGSCISITPEKSAKLWQFDAAGGISKPIVKNAESLFASSRDTNVYRLNIQTGELVWKYQMGAVLEEGPVVTEKMVYQHARNEGLSAIDKASGDLLWRLKDGAGLLAEATGKSYVITNAKMLVVIDNEKLKQMHRVELGDVSIYAANTADSKIYIADKEGRIACLSPIEY